MKNTVGGRIREAMRVNAPNRTQNEIERAAGLLGGQLSVLVNDKRQRPNTEHIRSVARALGVTFDWLAFGEGDILEHLVGTSESDALSGSAKTKAKRPHTPPIAARERQPNCLTAAELARAARYDRNAIELVVKSRHLITGDRPVLWWAWRMKALDDAIDFVPLDPPDEEEIEKMIKERVEQRLSNMADDDCRER